MTEEELVTLYDQMTEHTEVGTGFLLDELMRRREDRLAREMARYTRGVFVLTLLVTACTIVLTISTCRNLRAEESMTSKADSVVNGCIPPEWSRIVDLQLRHFTGHSLPSVNSNWER